MNDELYKDVKNALNSVFNACLKMETGVCSSGKCPFEDKNKDTCLLVTLRKILDDIIDGKL